MSPWVYESSSGCPDLFVRPVVTTRRGCGEGPVIGDRWGVSDAEVGRRYPCDDLVDVPAIELWRGVTVQAPPQAVWPWLRQLRIAPYSYDWVDNAGRRSPRTLLDLPDPRPGDPFSTFAGVRGVGRVLSVAPGEHLTAGILGALLSYVLVQDGETTRLLLKVVVPRRRWYARALALGDWPMARRQLLNLKRLAESAPPPTPQARTPEGRPDCGPGLSAQARTRAPSEAAGRRRHAAWRCRTSPR